jgi:hypothetical protein
MKSNFYILFRIRTIFIILFTYQLLLSCQQKKDIASEKSNDKTFVRIDSSDIAGEKKSQQAKLIQKDYETTRITNHGHPIHKNNNRYNELVEPVYHTPEPVSYQGGEFALKQFLETNNSYNSIKYYESIEGIVYLKLLVDKTGEAIEKKILRGIGLGIDEEALRLSSLLKFNPAKDSTGKAIRSDFILKIKFEKHPYPIVIIDSVSVKVNEPPGN